jgi:hypothetical protein
MPTRSSRRRPTERSRSFCIHESAIRIGSGPITRNVRTYMHTASDETTISQARSIEPVHFGVVLPVHNEEKLISAALGALDRAVGVIEDGRVSIGIAVVLDKCSDRSTKLVWDWRHRHAGTHDAHLVEIVETDVGNVGHARRAGCRALLHRWSGTALGDIWLATTDADSEVPQNWITAQLRVRGEGGQVWLGAVSVRDWSGRPPGTAEAWRHQYEAEPLPIHGASFGIDAAIYLATGGFEALATGEDRSLFERAVLLGAVVRHDPLIRVVTSGRREARAPLGFAHALTSIEARIESLPLDHRAELAPS